MTDEKNPRRTQIGGLWLGSATVVETFAIGIFNITTFVGFIMSFVASVLFVPVVFAGIWGFVLAVETAMHALGLVGEVLLNKIGFWQHD